MVRYFGLDINSSSSVVLSWPAGAFCPSLLCRWEKPCPYLPCIHIFMCQPSFLHTAPAGKPCAHVRPLCRRTGSPACSVNLPAEPFTHLTLPCADTTLLYGEIRELKSLWKHQTCWGNKVICSQLRCKYLLWQTQIHGCYQGFICCTADVCACCTHNQGKRIGCKSYKNSLQPRCCYSLSSDW